MAKFHENLRYNEDKKEKRLIETLLDLGRRLG